MELEGEILTIKTNSETHNSSSAVNTVVIDSHNQNSLEAKIRKLDQLIEA